MAPFLMSSSAAIRSGTAGTEKQEGKLLKTDNCAGEMWSSWETHPALLTSGHIPSEHGTGPRTTSICDETSRTDNVLMSLRHAKSLKRGRSVFSTSRYIILFKRDVLLLFKKIYYSEIKKRWILCYVKHPLFF